MTYSFISSTMKLKIFIRSQDNYLKNEKTFLCDIITWGSYQIASPLYINIYCVSYIFDQLLCRINIEIPAYQVELN